MKKLIAILLTLTLVAGMLPMVFAAEANTVVYDNATYEYVFKSQAHYINNDRDTEDADGDGDIAETNPLRGLSSGKHTVENTDPEVSDGWGFVNVKTATNFSTNTTNTHWSFVASTSTPPAYSPDENANGGVDILAFELQIDKKGTFDAELSFTAHKSSPHVEVFLVKKPENAESVYYEYWKDAETGKVDSDKAATAINAFVKGLSANARLGTAKNVNSVNDHSFGRIKIEEAGRYFLILVPNGLPEGWEPTSSIYGYLQLNKFTLTEVVSDKREELTYVTTKDAFDFSNVKTSSSDYGERIQSLRSGVGTNCTDLLTWEKKVTINKSGETVEPFSPMNLEATDPWSAISWYGYNIWLDTADAGNGFRMQYSKNSYGNTSSCHFTLFKIRVPYAGEYKFAMKAKKDAEGVVPLIYFIPADTTVTANAQCEADSTKIYAKNSEAFALVSGQTPIGYFNFSTVEIPELDDKGTDADGYTYIANVTASKGGDYYVMIDPDGADDDNDGINNSLEYNSTVDANNRQDLYFLGIRLTPVVTDEEKAEAEAAAAAEAEKNAIINFTGGSITTPDDTTAPAASDVNALAAYIGGDEVNAVLTDAVTKNADGTVTVAAPEEDPEGYTFLYWAKGMENYKGKQIVSSSRSMTFKPATEATYYIAVYKADTANAEPTASFYDMNGQLLGTKTGEFDVASLADMPAVAGHGAFTGWLGSDGKTYAKDDTTAMTMTDDISFMAQYEGAEGVDITVQNESGTALTPIVKSAGGTITTYGDYEIKVKDAEGNAKTAADAAYGDTVTVIANAREGGSGYNTFNYWMKNGEVVSFNKSYTFKAFEDCTLVPVYKAYEPTLASEFRKIILTKTGSQLMAEFIGFEDAVEKGIMIDNRKIAMTTDNTHFTVNMDEGSSAKAYAIDENGTYYSEAK